VGEGVNSRRIVLHVVDVLDDADAPILACIDAMAANPPPDFVHHVLLRCESAERGLSRARLLGLAVDATISRRTRVGLSRTVRLLSRRSGVGGGEGSGGSGGSVVCVGWTCGLNASTMWGNEWGNEQADALLYIELALGRWMGLVTKAGGFKYFDLPEQLAAAHPRIESGLTPRRDAIRASLGVRPHDVLIVPLCDPPGLLDARAFADLTAILHVADFPCVGLLPRNALFISKAVRHWREGYVKRLLLTDDPMTCFLAAADLAVMPGAHDEATFASRLQLGRALSMGISVVMPGKDSDEAAIAGEGRGVYYATDARAASLAGACVRALDRRALSQNALDHPAPETASRPLSYEGDADESIGRFVAAKWNALFEQIESGANVEVVNA